MRLKALLPFLMLLWYLPLRAQVIDVTLQAPSNTLCAGSSMQLLAHVTGASGAVSYTWTPMTGLSGPLDSIKIASPATTTLYKVRVTDAQNHSDSATFTITVLPSPTAAFIFSPDYGCAGTSVTFINNSSAGTYYWDLGDGTTSTLQYPTHGYPLVTGNDTTSYVAKLIVTASNNCTDTVTGIVHVKKVPDASLIDPLTNFGNCANASYYNQQYPITVYNSSTTNNVSYKIIWGDNTPNFVSTGFVSTTHIYTTLGVFYLTFEVTGANGCVASHTYLITNISNPAISFGGMGSTMGCTPTSVCFTIGNYSLNHSTTLYVVNFGDGSPPVTLTHPPPDTICHTYNISSCGHTGITGCLNCFVASITAKNACDSTKNTTDNIRTFSKIVAGYTSPVMGCVNQPVTFTNTSMGGHNYLCDTTGIYTWDFGDGTPPVVVAMPTPQNHTYAAPGIYTVTLSAENIPCGLSSYTNTICINPLPQALFTLSDSVFCRPGQVTVTNLSNLTQTCNQATFTWSITCINDSCSTLGCGGYSFTGGTSITSFSPQILFTRPGKYTIKLTVNNGCNPPAVYSKVIRVKSKPTVTLPVIPSRICQGGSITPTSVFTSCYGNTSYLWTFTGGSPSSSTQQNPGTITYSTAGTYTITVKASNSCGDSTRSKTIVVKPLPVVTQKPNIAVCPASSIIIGAFSSTIPGTTYTWTNSNTAIGLVAGGTGNISNWISPANNTGSNITGTITVIPTYDSCSGTPMTFTVTIYPTPNLAFVPNVAVCAGQQINFGLWSSNVTGTTYTWTNSNVAIGIPASGTGDITPWNAPPNNTTSNIVGTITVRPTSPNGCQGPPISFTVTIYPTPVVNAVTNIAVCPGQAINIPNFTGNLTGTTFNWTNTNTSIGIGASGTGNIPSWTAPANNTGANITGTITVTPSKNGCPGIPITFTVTIYPTPSITQINNIAVCPLQPISIGNFVVLPAGTTVTWTNTNTSIGLGASGSGNIPGWTAPINGTGVNITGTITVTPSLNGCTGPDMVFTVTIYPATAVQQVSNIAVCPGQPINPGTFVSMPAGASFTWTNTNTAIGIAASGSGSIPQWTAPANGTLNPIVGTITVTPSSNGCAGSPMTFTVTINPIPDVTASPMIQAICSGSTTAVAISSTYPGATFAWTVVAPGGISGASAGSGNAINQTLVNTNLVTDTVRYTITPTIGACSGASVTVKIAVYPKVIMTAVPSQSVCPGVTITIPAFTSNLAGTTYAWTNSNTAIGLGASGTGNIPAWTAPSNMTTSNISGTITVTPTSANGCAGAPVTFSVTIYPTPVITQPADVYVCPGQSVSVGNFISNLGGTTFNWVNNNTAIGLSASGSGNIPAWTAPVNGTGVNISGTITVTPVKNGCSGTAVSFTVNIYPTPVVTVVNNIAVCPGQAISVPGFSSTPSGASFTWTNSNIAIGLAASGSGAINGWNAPANNTGANITGTISVTPSLNGCSGPVMSFTVTVYPTPLIPQHANITVCPGQQINIGNFTSVPGGSTFSWTNTNTAIGIAGSGNGNIPAWTAPPNNTFIAISGTISVTPTLNGCQGNAMSFNVNISPQPDVTATPMVQTICSSTAAVITPGSSYAGVTFSWTYAAPSGITGASNGSGVVINQTLVNTSLITDTVYYTITASLAGCSSASVIAKVAVYPAVVMNPVSAINVCPATTVTVPAFSANLAGTTWSWTNSNTAIGLGASGTGNITAWTAPANSTMNNITGTITVTPTSPQGCAGSPVSFTVSVYPTPTVNPVSSVFVCPGTVISAIAFSGNPAGTTFNWTNSNTAIGLGASGSGNIPGWTAPANNTNVIITGTITVTPVRNGCPGLPESFTVNIYPTPTVNAVSNIAVCPQQPISIPAFGSTPAGGSFTWTNSNTAIGLSASGSGNITGWNAPANNTGLNINGTISVTPSLNGCAGPAMNFTVTIYPTPAVTQQSNITVCPGAQISINNFVSAPAGSTFSWSNTNTAIGLAASGNGNILPWTAPPNNTLSAISGTISVVPTLNGCSGNAMTFTVNISPQPDAIATPMVQTICSNAAAIINLSSSNTGVSYSWTAAAPGSITGASGGTGAVINQTLANSGLVTDTVRYTVTTSLGGCNSVPIIAKVAVHPTIGMSAIAPISVCPATSITVPAFTSNLPGSTFAWTNSNTAIGLGATGTGNIPSWTAPANGTLNNIVGTITVTPTSPQGCAGNPRTFTITIYPTPTVNPVSSVSVCPGTVISAFSFSGNLAGTTFNWTNSNTAIGLGGSGSGNIPGWTAPANNTNLTISGTITVTPVRNGCQGVAETFTVNIYPTPTVNAVSNVTICPQQAISIPAFVSTPAGGSFTWTNSNTAIGLGASGSGNIAGWNAPANNTGVNINGTISITPSLNGCAGPVRTFTVTVYPTPSANAVSNITVCPGQQITIGNFSSSPTGSTFNWANSNTAIGLAASGTGNIPAWTAPPNGTLSNISGTITVTPVLNGCTGNSTSFTVNIAPVPNVTASPMTQYICSNTAAVVNISSTYPGTTFSWTVTAPSGISGALAGSGNTINQTLVNSTNHTDSLTYTITPQLGNCPGQAVTVKVVVYSSAIPIATPANQTICSGASTLINLTSNPPNASFTWVVSAPAGISGASGGSGTQIIQALTNSTVTPQVVNYTVTPNSNNCPGVQLTIPVTVNPLPQATASPAISSICSGSTTSIGLTSTVAGTTYSWIVVAPVGINGAAPGNGNQILQTITTSLNVIDTAHYAITPSAAACPGATITANVLVKPKPQLSMAPPSQTVCAGDTSALINLTSNVAGTTYTWNGVASAGISGYIASGSGNVPGMILTNGTVNQGTVTYSAVPTANGCVGNLGQSVITINPTPSVTNSPLIQQICSGQHNAPAVLTSNVANTQFSWTVTHSGNITGFTPSGSGTIPAQLLTNPGTQVDTVIYHIVPYIVAGITCTGVETDYLVIVNPLPVAAFAMSTNVACSPAGITFTNQSTPATLTYNWNFGNGHTSTVQHPVAAFTNTGVIDSIYNITLIIHMNNTGCADTVSHSVTIHPQPVAGFAFTNVCLGQATSFTNTSVNTLGTINSWNWNFGDGDTSVVQNPSHYYGTSGNFNVAFIVGTSIGCQDTATHTITVHPLPVAGFTHPSHGCKGVAVQFLNTTSGGQNYLWTFGDGFTSNQINGSHAYASTGHYLVTLIGISVNGCRDTISDSIHIIQVPTPDFTVTPDNGCAPLPVDIFNLTTGDSVSYLWDFGVVPSSTLPGPFNITFPQGMADTTYVITLAASNMCGTVYHYDSITVYPQPIVNFGMSVNSGCSPIAIQFHDTIAGMPLVMYWDFGDGSPVQQYTTFSQQITHTFVNNGLTDTTFTITLIAQNGCGLDTMQRTVLVHPNTVYAFFNTDTLSGCKPLTVTFTNFSTQNTQAFWTFGDGNVSNASSPTHTYLNSGQYVVMLTVTNGCSHDTVWSDTITVFPSASVSFTSNNNLCSGDTVFFNSSGNGITNYQWDFGDGGQSVLTNPYHIYTSSGNFPVTLSVNNQFNCPGTASGTIHVRFKPDASFAAGPPSGCSPFDVQFSNLTDSLTYNTYTWYFGNGGSSVLTNPSQLFSNSSNCSDTTFNVMLIANNSGCADTVTAPVVVHPKPVSEFYAQDSVYCSFEVPAIIQFYQQAYCAQGFQWYSDNTGVSTAPDPQIIFPAEGNYNISLVMSNQYQCSDTATHLFRVYPSLENSLSITPTAGCAPLTVNFATSIDSIAYNWQFGDNGSSNLQTPVHTYQNPGSYSVTLMVYGNGGCSKSIFLEDTISVYPVAHAGFSYQNVHTFSASDGGIEFINTSSTASIFFWDFGDNTTYSGFDTIHRYSTNGTYEVMLIANNEFNCPDTIFEDVTPEDFHGLYFPNAFSPDNDNALVRVFKPVGVGLKTLLVQVYDTWGNVIWETTALDADGRPTEAWDGTDKDGKPMPMDTYAWTASGTFEDGTIWRGMDYNGGKPRKYGTVTIIR